MAVERSPFDDRFAPSNPGALRADDETQMFKVPANSAEAPIVSELEGASVADGEPSASVFTLPAPTLLNIEAPLASTSAPGIPKRLRTTWLLATTVASGAGAAAIAAYQMGRAMSGEERLSALTPPQIMLAVLAAVGTLAWTWMVVENARRLLAAGRTTDAPDPNAVAAAWAMPLVVGAAAAISIAFLESRLNTADSDTTSAIPLALTLLFIVICMLVSHRPLFMLSSIMRRLGSSSGALAGWIWVPISLVLAGAATLVGLRVGGAYGDEYVGVAPAWALGVVAMPPVVILIVLAWRGGRDVEDAVGYAFDRRTGRDASGVGRRGVGLYTRLLRANARPAASLDTRKRIRIVPGADTLRLSLMIAVAALTLVSIVGALVMILFWRESGNGPLLPSQRDRAWTALEGLEVLERYLAAGLIAIAAIWSFVSVLNARLASGRRRNPLLAAAAWPGAAYMIWLLAVRLADAESAVDALVVYGLQIAVLYVPFFLLERAAVAVGARRGPLRLTYCIAAVLLIHIQGLGGLSNLVEVTEIDLFGRLAGYLALAALLELIATIAITDASHVIADAAATTADKHNFLAEQRSTHEDRARPVAAPAARLHPNQPESTAVAARRRLAMGPARGARAPVPMANATVNATANATSAPLPPPPTSF